MFLPHVQNFKEFWNKYIFVDEDDYEINEVLLMFADIYNMKNMDEHVIFDLLQHYYPDIKIEGKTIHHIGCTLWNKKNDINTFIKTLDSNSSNQDSNKDIDIYSLYCVQFKNKKKVSKSYFMRFI